MTTWTVAGQVVGEAGPGLWVRVKRVLLPNGDEMPLHERQVYFCGGSRSRGCTRRCQRTCGGSAEPTEMTGVPYPCVSLFPHVTAQGSRGGLDQFPHVAKPELLVEMLLGRDAVQNVHARLAKLLPA